jgi:hypothetical protein
MNRRFSKLIDEKSVRVRLMMVTIVLESVKANAWMIEDFK